ncbi:uncharacterized protein [Antedon mediterranea]|uniref:uncharacterized protein n=1 Tax=Antedon mediterranea TaxID=105859 RepID=UPI003AF6A19F
MSTERFSEVTRVSSCPQRICHIRPCMVTSNGGTQRHQRSAEGSKPSKVIGNGHLRPIHTWFSIAGKKSGVNDGWSSNQSSRWATRQAELRIRNRTVTPSKNTERVHTLEESIKLTSDNRQPIDDDHEKKLNVSENTRQKYDHVTKRKIPVQQEKQFRKAHHKKVKTLVSVYMNESAKIKRHERLLSKLEDIQITEAKTEHEQALQKEESRQHNWKRQVVNLRKIRQRFDDEQTVRFQKQFVSWKSVEKYRYNQSSSGLPDVLPTFPSDEGARSANQKLYFNPIAREKLRERNKKRYENILDPNINRKRTDIKQPLPKAEAKNNLVLEDAEQVLFNAEMDLTSSSD